MRDFHAFCLAAPRSGEGKTAVAVALMRALVRRGLAVQGCKCGPDYIDPTFHALATGRPACNLDTWMMGEAGVRAQWRAAVQGADAAVCEGVMGLLDGRSPDDLSGSTLDCARVLHLPVLLVVNVRGMAASLTALVEGFQQQAARHGVRLAGVIANNAGSPRHADILRQALEKFKAEASLGEARQFLASAKTVKDLHVLATTRSGVDTAELRTMGDFLRDKDPKAVAVIASINGEKITFLAVCGKEAVARGIKAGDLVRHVSAICGGKGGGKPDSAMGGGSDPLKVDDALASVDDFVSEKLG